MIFFNTRQLIVKSVNQTSHDESYLLLLRHMRWCFHVMHLHLDIPKDTQAFDAHTKQGAKSVELENKKSSVSSQVDRKQWNFISKYKIKICSTGFCNPAYPKVANDGMASNEVFSSKISRQMTIQWWIKRLCSYQDARVTTFHDKYQQIIEDMGMTCGVQRKMDWW